ncbi:MAG TPA: threonine ammonia-lyase [Acidimicrobiales bacterium]
MSSAEDARDLPVTIDDVEAAAKTIAGAVVRTPSALSETLSDILGCTVVLKFEGFQFTAAYKERGARNRLAALDAGERACGVVAVSAGNHAQAVARHAHLLGIPATIVMPVTTPFVKVARTRHLGASVELNGADFAGALARGHELVAEGRTLVHPFDDPLVVAGQGTVALEVFEDHDDLDAIVVPVGGGGLVSGVAVVAAAKAPHVEVVGVQVETYPGMVNALGGLVPPAGGTTMAEGIAVATPGVVTEQIVRALRPELLVVPETAVEDAVALVLEIEKVVVEGAAAAAIAALAVHRDRFAGRTVGVVLTGANIDPRLLASVIERGLVRSGRLARLRVALDDRPGALGALLTVVGGAGANLLEVQHQRLFADIPARAADVDLVVECLDAAHRDAIVAAVEAAGYRARLLSMAD